MNTEPLEDIGLTRNESIVYITLLEIGRSHINQISEKTKMHRRTIYDCLERLEDRGLVSYVIEGKTRFFSAVNPNKLKEIIRHKEIGIENILPELMHLANQPKSSTEVNINKSKEGLRNIMEDILKTKPKKWYSLTSAGKVLEVFPVYEKHWHQKRVKNKTNLQIIFGRNRQAIKRANVLKKLKHTEVKMINSKYVAPISLWIYNNKVAFMLWESQTGILIEDKQSAETFKNYFKVLWGISKSA